MTEPAADHVAGLARAFFAGMGPTFEDFVRTFETMLSEEVVWESVGFDRHDGKAECLAYLDTLRATTGFEYCTIGVQHLAVDGDVVLTERLDTMFRADGTVIMDFRVAGALQFRGDKVIRYTDYLDTHGTIQRLTALASEMGHAAAQ